jgi:hypothetical protein
MVILKKQVILLFSVLTIVNIYAEQLDKYKDIAEVTKHITFEAETDNYSSPIQTVLSLIKNIGDENLYGYYNCMATNKQSELLKEQRMTLKELQILSKNYKNSKTNNIALYNLNFTLTTTNIEVELCFETIGINTLVKETYHGTLIQENNSWKFNNIEEKVINRTKIKTDN